MSHQLVHNHDTSIKTLASVLNAKLKLIPNLNNSPELNLCSADRDIVSVVQNSASQDIENLIKLLNSKDHDPDTFLPQVLIVQSNIIQPSQFGRNMKKFKMNDAITIVNKDDENEKITLAGRMFTYETPLQILILTRSKYASKELSLHIQNILANNKRIDYLLKLHDTDNPNELYAVEDYGHIKIVGVENATFSESTVQESGITVVGAELMAREQFFMFKDNDYIMRQWRVNIATRNTN